MKGYTTALGLALLLGVAGASSAATAVIDFSDTTKTVDAAVVDQTGGKITQVKEGTVNAAKTGGTADNQYLYIDVKDGLLAAGKPLYVQVTYLDRGTDTWQMEYNTDSDPATLAQPVVNKLDTGAWKTITFKQVDANLTGALDGKADLRINDNADGAETIQRVVISDVDPQIVQFPHVDPAHAVVIDGKKDTGEWDGALVFVLDRPEQDAIQPSKQDPATFSGTYSFKWDEKGMYVYGEVIDATPRLNDADGPNYWNGDGIELFLALDWSDPNHTTYISGTDFHLFFGMGATPAWANQNADETADNGPLPADMLAISNTDKGYNFELSVPWAKLNPNLKVTPGQQIGFYMFANNSTVTPSAQEIALTPYKRNGPSGNPSRWATAVLSTDLTAPAPPL
jgi:cellulose/xylan binding protein with CBM9 domain